MNTNHVSRGLAVTALGLAMLLVLAAPDAARAQNSGEPEGTVTAAAVVPCGSEGTWFGLADNGFSWLNTITRGTGGSNGHLDLTWVSVGPALFDGMNLRRIARHLGLHHRIVSL